MYEHEKWDPESFIYLISYVIIIIVVSTFFLVDTVAVNSLPNFTADPNPSRDVPLPLHQATIHLNCEHSDLIHQGYLDALMGRYSQKYIYIISGFTNKCNHISIY